MPLTQQLLLKVNTYLLGFLVVAGSIISALLTIFLIHFLVPHYKPNKPNEVVNIIFRAKTLIYALLLSIILFTSWHDFKSASTDVQKEADCLVELHRSTEAFLPEIKEKIDVLLNEYTKSIVEEEWKTLAKNELNPRTGDIARKIWQVYTSYSPKSPTEEVFLQESIRKLYELREDRTKRLSDSEAGVFPLLWLVLIIGALVTVASIAFFADGLKAKVIMAVLYAIIIGLVFFTILLFDYPYTGMFIVSPKPLLRAMLRW